jgi:membrane fusion protein, heavy metal efflux system
MKNNHNLVLLLFCAVTGALFSCHKSNLSDAANKKEEILPDDIVELRYDQIKFSGIETGSVSIRSIQGTLQASGKVTVAPRDLVSVCAPMGGFVIVTNIMTGMAVKKGQVLTILENQDFVDIQQQYLEAKNKLEYAEAEFNRHNALYKEDVYSQQNVQQVTSEYKILKAQVKALEQKVSMIGIDPDDLKEDGISNSISVLAPMSGYIRSANVNTGKYVASSDVMFEIVNLDKLLLELTLFEKDAGKVKTGYKIHFFINNETEEHQAVIYETGKSINADKTYTVYATVAKTCNNIMPGMYVNAEIVSPGNDVTALPSDAIVSFDDKDYIFVFEKNKQEAGKDFSEYRMVEVKKGLTDNGFTEVILPEGFDIKSGSIVIKGAYSLLSAKKNAGEMAC